MANEIIDNIIRKYNFYVAQWKSNIDIDNLYLKAFQERLTLQEYGMWPEEAAMAFSVLTKLHIGKDVKEIKELTNKLADYNVRHKRHNHNVPHPLTEEELKAVTEYHKYLFATCIKNENPFNNLNI